MENTQVPPISVDFFETLTGTLTPSEAAAGEDVGQRIAAIRREKGLSVEDLARMTGFSVEIIAGIENNTVAPQLGTIMRLGKALDQAVSRLISGQGNKPYEITRKGERKIVARATKSGGGSQLYTYQSLAHEVKGRHMEPLVVELDEVAEPEKSMHEGEEFILVLSGTALLSIGEDRHELNPGDCVYYISSVSHSISGKGGKAVILAVLYE